MLAPSSLLRRMLVALSITLSACSLQPVHDRAALKDDNPPPAGPVDGVEIDSQSGEPLPVVRLKSDRADDAGSVIQADDIWQRVREGFALAEVEDHTRVRHYESWYQSEPGYLRLVTGRAEPYLYFILEEIERRGLPTELALLPIVESAYIPFAYSRSHAAGIWQFIPATGRLYGLKQNWWYDGRRDVYASTLAALDYLEAINELMGGDWFNTLAAYNAGPGRVLREIEKNRRAGKPTDYWNLSLPAETRNYVPKLLAVKSLVQDPASFGIELWPIEDAPYLTAVEIGSQIDLALASELAGMGLDAFRLLNPGFNQWATDPDGPHRLLLPQGQAENFLRSLAALPGEKRVSWLRHPISSGETLTHIAQRYRTSVSLLQQTNDLRGSQIHAGSYLLVPQSLAAVGSAGARKPESTPRTHAQHTHVVRRGDSLWSIARSYQVSVNDLLSWNGKGSSDLIQAGDTLIVRDGNTLAGSDAQAGSSAAFKSISYSVQRGDSLYAIARRFNVEIDDLRRWNNMRSRTLLYPGQAMTVYLTTAQPEI
jgi:membrane-bound lytic murein transglycosylase D